MAKRIQTGYSLDDNLFFNLRNLSLMYQIAYDEKLSASEVVNRAVKEYFINHREEINAIVSDFTEKAPHLTWIKLEGIEE